MSVASTVRRMASSAIVTGALLASSAVVAHAQPSTAGFYGTGGDVSVKYVFSSAADIDQLYYRIGNANPIGDFGFTNVFASYTILPNFASNVAAANQQIDIGPVCAGCEVVFLLRNTSFGGSHYTGSALRGTDAPSLHVSLLNGTVSHGAAIGGGTYETKFGFEDRQPLATSDADYNDIQFEVAGVGPRSVTPEPSSYALMATGLLALGVAARRRRKV